MKIDRRGFLGASILAAIPAIAAMCSVIEKKPKFLVHKLNPENLSITDESHFPVSVVHCDRLLEPEISISHWEMPSYLVKIQVTDGRNPLFRLTKEDFPIGNIVSNEVIFRGKFGKECSVRQSDSSRIMLAKYGFHAGARVGKTLPTGFSQFLPYMELRFWFHEVPPVIFKEKNQTAEELFGVGHFPSFGE